MKRSTRHSLIMSALSLLLCASMLIGTTFAWFTDSVTSTGNKIQSGTLVLDLEMYDKDNTTADKYASIKESKAPIFNYEKWEPGYTEVKLLKIENEGTLALKWYAKFVSSEKLSILSDVIDVWVKKDTNALAMPDTRDLEADGYQYVGNLTSFINTIETTTKGELMPMGEAGDKIYLGLALKMQESAGNEYQDKKLGEFDIQLLATQLTYEDDSFDETYDENAAFPEEISTLGELIKALNNNQNVKLTKNIDLAGETWTPIANYSGTLDGNGYAIQNLKGANGLFTKISGATIKNLTLENVDIQSTDARTGAIAGQVDKVADADQTVISNVTVTGNVKGGGHYTGGFIGADRSYDTLIVDSVNYANVTGTHQVGGFIGQANRLTVVDNCTNNGDVTADIIAGGIIGLIAGDDNNTNLTVTVSDCTNNGEVKELVGSASHTLAGGIAGAVGRDGGDSIVNMITAFIINPTVAAGQNIYGEKFNYADGKDTLITVVDTEVSNGLYKDANGNYYVYNAEALIALNNWIIANYSSGSFWGKTYNVMADIDATGYIWTTKHITPDSSNVSGITFNGNGHTISNLTINGTGLFTGATRGTNGAVASVVKNLTLDNLTLNGGSHHNGAVWGEAYGDLTVEKVNVTNSSITGGCNVGGLVGRNSESNATIKFIDCSVTDTEITATTVADYAGASAFYGMALTIGSSTTIDLEFEGTNVASGNTLTSASGLQGGGIYTVATWGDETWETPVVVNGFDNYHKTTYNPTKYGGLYEYLPTLQKGDVLILPEQTYVTSGTFTIPDGVTIKGEAGKTVLIQQISTYDDIFSCIGDAVIENISFETNLKGYAIAGPVNNNDHDGDGDIVVRNCSFKGTATDKNWGIYKNLNGNLTVENCTFDNYNNALCGIKNKNGSTTTIKGCTFTNINDEAIGYVISDMPADFEAEVIANNTGLTAENVIGY
ncbi:MAG: hypothetical protein IJP16_01275 [Clostridia bacterium]|nr:hypothetical protein [Clostridia bacterium]